MKKIQQIKYLKSLLRNVIIFFLSLKSSHNGKDKNKQNQLYHSLQDKSQNNNKNHNKKKRNKK